jgi:hypothetical protein
MPFALAALFFASGYAYPANRMFNGYGQLIAFAATALGYMYALGGQGLLYGDSLPKGMKRVADWLRIALELFAVIYISLASEFRESLLYKLLIVFFIAVTVFDVARLIWVQHSAIKSASKT